MWVLQCALIPSQFHSTLATGIVITVLDLYDNGAGFIVEANLKTNLDKTARKSRLVWMWKYNRKKGFCQKIDNKSFYNNIS